MPTLRLILGDQLSESISSLRDCDIANDVVLLCEVWEEATYVKHHKKKIVLLFSAMRHFAAELQQRGYRVVYTKLDDANNSGSLRGETVRWLRKFECERVVVTHPGEYRVLEDMRGWTEEFGVDVDILADDRFLCAPDYFRAWARGSKQLRMEYFYRDMRKQYGVLMEGDKPVGGEWNYDFANRKPPKMGMDVPTPHATPPDAITEEVTTLVAERCANHFGAIENFNFAVTRDQALSALDKFITERLVNFGDYQDAMLEGEPWMYHSHISLYLNCGLLLPLECIRAAEQAYHQGLAPVNAVEGFIRQIIGWREYIHGVYWLMMPGYHEKNFLQARRRLPEFYWSGDTKMNCLRQCVLETRRNAYAHHIQRLMVLGNFALIAGIDPKEVNEWFLIVYADAYEWIELPNVSGMALFADGGYLASKPYASGGSYINKMSNYCDNCSYKVSQKNGPDACPFNYLYWDFLGRNRTQLQSNPRIGMMYKALERMGEDKRQAVRNDSAVFFRNIDNGVCV